MTDVTSRWRWVVLASSFFALFLTGFAPYHVGVMNVALLRHLNTDVRLTTWLMSYYAGSFALTAPVGSALINLTSCRTCVVMSGLVCMLGFVLSSLVNDLTSLFFTFTLLGVGQGMCNTGSIMILGYYFPTQASIASGVSISGGALGIFLHPPLLQGLVDWYGLQGALLLSGAVAFQGSIFGALMRPSSLEKKVTHNRSGNTRLQRLCALVTVRRGAGRSPLLSRATLLFLLSVFILSLGYHTLLVLLPYHLVHVGDLTPTEASLVVSLIGVGSFFSRLATGFLSHDPRVGHILMFCGLNGVQGLLSLAAPSLIAQGIVGSYAYCFLMGIYSGGIFSLLLPIVQDIVGLNHCATGLGFTFFMFGVGGLLGAPLTNLVQETFSHHYAMFAFLAVLLFTSAILSSLVTTVLPKPQSDSDHPPHDPEEEAQLTTHQTESTEKQAKSPSKHALKNSAGVEDVPLAASIECKSEEIGEDPLLEVTTPLCDGVAGKQTSVEDSHVTDAYCGGKLWRER